MSSDVSPECHIFAVELTAHLPVPSFCAAQEPSERGFPLGENGTRAPKAILRGEGIRTP
jgi:hypothetical protein